MRCANRILLLSCLGLFAARSGHATQTYCVSTPSELRDALAQAEVDGEDSRIDLRAGTYNFTSELRYYPAGEHIIPAGSLAIEGGYGTGCASRVDDASLTVLHSNAGEKFFLETATGSVSLKTLTLDQVPLSFTGNFSLGSDPCAANDLKFEARRLRMIGGKLATVSECHDIVLRDSLFTNASDGTALDIYLVEDDDEGFVSNSLTMINDTIADGRLRVYACCDLQGGAFLYNNVFRSTGTEISAEATNVFAFNNRYDSLSFSGNANLPSGGLLASTNNLTSNPDLDANYRPNPGSPMVNSGTADVPGGLLSIDLYGAARVVGPSVDRGALESPVDGTGVYTVTNTNSSGSGSLADAVTLANNDSGFNTIRFNISGSCPRRIVLAATLTIRDSVQIDGWSQPGSVLNTDDLYWNAVPCIILDGNNAVGTGILTGSQLGTGSMAIRGIAFEGFSAAVLLNFGFTNQIYGSQFGGQIGSSGTTLAGNGDAILVAAPASNALIGGDEPSQRNLIGGSSASGVSFQGTSGGNQVINNLIGVDKDVIHDLPNQDGIRIFTSNNRVIDNRISRNARDGIQLTGSNAVGNVIEGNILGGVVGAFSLLGNERMGVLVDNGAHDNTIGPDNVINKNGDSGVRVLSAAYGHNRIIANRMTGNGAPGIDLGANGVTPNDSDPQICDLTTGCSANRGQNFPVLQVANRVTSGDTVGLFIGGSLRTTVSSSPYRIDFYRSSTCASSGYGEGTHWIGTKNVIVENAGICASGNCSKDFSFGTLNDAAVQAGDAISTTATSPSGDTSEFSECVFVQEAITDRIFADDFE
ncbi:MAG: right-handed parallel beta-helix repeat-containing protein [Dokdonella sp.]